MTALSDAMSSLADALLPAFQPAAAAVGASDPFAPVAVRRPSAEEARAAVPGTPAAASVAQRAATALAVDLMEDSKVGPALDRLALLLQSGAVVRWDAAVPALGGRSLLYAVAARAEEVVQKPTKTPPARKGASTTGAAVAAGRAKPPAALQLAWDAQRGALTPTSVLPTGEPLWRAVMREGLWGVTALWTPQPNDAWVAAAQADPDLAAAALNGAWWGRCAAARLPAALHHLRAHWAAHRAEHAWKESTGREFAALAHTHQAHHGRPLPPAVSNKNASVPIWWDEATARSYLEHIIRHSPAPASAALRLLSDGTIDVTEAWRWRLAHQPSAHWVPTVPGAAALHWTTPNAGDAPPGRSPHLLAALPASERWALLLEPHLHGAGLVVTQQFLGNDVSAGTQAAARWWAPAAWNKMSDAWLEQEISVIADDARRATSLTPSAARGGAVAISRVVWTDVLVPELERRVGRTWASARTYLAALSLRTRLGQTLGLGKSKSTAPTDPQLWSALAAADGGYPWARAPSECDTVLGIDPAAPDAADDRALRLTAIAAHTTAADLAASAQALIDRVGPTASVESWRALANMFLPALRRTPVDSAAPDVRPALAQAAWESMLHALIAAEGRGREHRVGLQTFVRAQALAAGDARVRHPQQVTVLPFPRPERIAALLEALDGTALGKARTGSSHKIQAEEAEWNRMLLTLQVHAAPPPDPTSVGPAPRRKM